MHHFYSFNFFAYILVEFLALKPNQTIPMYSSILNVFICFVHLFHSFFHGNKIKIYENEFGAFNWNYIVSSGNTIANINFAFERIREMKLLICLVLLFKEPIFRNHYYAYWTHVSIILRCIQTENREKLGLFMEFLLFVIQFCTFFGWTEVFR